MATGDAADIKIGISADTIMFMKDMRQVGYALEHLASTARSIGFSLTAAVTAPLVGIGTASVVAAGKIEQTTVAFEGLLGSSEEAAKQMEWMKEFAKKTPFRFEDITKATQGFLAYGFTVEQSNKMMMRLTDAVAAFGGSSTMIDSVTRALGQMSGRQKVTAQEMTQLTETGLPAWKMLADYLKTDVKTAMEMVSDKDNPVSADIGIAAIMQGMADPKYAGAAERQMNTLNGVISNIQDSLFFLSAEIGENFLPLLKTLANDYILPGIDYVGKLSEKFSELPMNIQLAAVAIAGLAAAAGPAFLVLSQLLQIGGGWLAAGTVLKTFFDTRILGKTIEGVSGAGAAKKAAKAVAKGAGGARGADIAAMAGIDFLGKGTAKKGASIAAIAGIDYLGAGAGGAALAGGATAAGGAAGGGGLVATLTGLLPVIAIIVAVVAAIVALVATFKSAYDQSEMLREAVATLFMRLEDLGKVIIDTIFPGTKDVSSLFDKLVKIFNDVRKAFDDFGKSCAPIFVEIIDYVTDLVELFTKNFPAIWKTINDVAKAIADQLVGAVMWLWDAIQPLVNAIVKFANDLWNALIPAFTELADAVIPVLVEVLGDVWDVMERVWGELELFVIPAIQFLIRVVVALSTAFVEIAGPIIIGIIVEIIDTIKALAKIALDSLGIVLDFLSGDFSGAWEHVKSIIGTVFGWMGDTVKNILDTANTLAVSIGNSIYDFFVRIYNGCAEFVNKLIEKYNALPGTEDLAKLGMMMDTAAQQQAAKDAMQATWNDAYGGGNVAVAGTSPGTWSTTTANAAIHLGGISAPTNMTTSGQIITGVGGRMFAEGGIATRPTFGIFGEAGPEAIIPLNRLSYGRDLTVIIEMDGTQIAKKTAPATADIIRMRQAVR